MSRRSAIGCATASLLLLGVILGLTPWLLQKGVSSRLAALGCHAGETSWRWTGFRLLATDLVCAGLTAARVELGLARPWAPRIRLDGADLDLAARSSHGTTSGTGGRMGPGPSVEFTDLRLRLGDFVLAEALSGTSRPLDVRGPGTRVALDGDLVRVHLERPIATTHLKGVLSLDARVDPARESFSGSATASRLALEHPALARKPLDADGASFAFDGSWDGGLRVTGRGSLQACPFAFAVREGKEGRLLELELPETDLERVLLPLEPIVPEAGRARVEGSVSARVTLGPDARREIVFDLDLQRVTGALPPGVHLDGGPFTFLARDRHGELRPRPCGEGTANWASLDEISPWVTNAILASEDIGFYRHHGVDPEAIREALIEDLAAGSIRRGGSTLTQQLAKNLFLDGEQTLSRKLREALFAVELDGSLGKRRVLELYVNVVEWGPGIYGIREASRHYLLKDPSRIHPLEAAFLAALLPSPRRFHRTWFLAGRVPRARLDAILDNMAHAGWLDAASRDAWKARPLELAPPPGDGETADFE